MNPFLSLLQLYSEWGVDEVLTALPTDHLESIPARPTFSIPEKRPVPENPIQNINQHLSLKTNNLQEICQAILNFKSCPLRDTAMHSILPKGNPEASLYLIGDVPDADEDRNGQVFAGQGEFWLRQLLDSIQLSFDACFQMPLLPWRPPGGRQVSKNELESCLPFLYQMLNLYSPPYILTIGLLPAQTLLQASLPFSQLRGKWHRIQNPHIKPSIQLFPLPHPAQLNTSAKIRQATWQDLLQIRLQMEQVTDRVS